MTDTPHHQSGVTDFLSWLALVGARGIFVSAGAPLTRGAWGGLIENTRLTSETGTGYYARK
jgi:hypothetical protein